MVTENNLVNELFVYISQLKAINESRSRFRKMISEKSTFKGVNFKPTGFVVLKVFKPYGRDQDTKNLSYDRKAKCSDVNLDIFSEDKEVYDS
jgi:hypothetical protein